MKLEEELMQYILAKQRLMPKIISSKLFVYLLHPSQIISPVHPNIQSLIAYSTVISIIRKPFSFSIFFAIN